MARRRKKLLKKYEVQIAKRKRTCKNSGSAIRKGEACLVVWDSQYDKKPYSRDVALQMISDARETLDAIEDAL